MNCDPASRYPSGPDCEVCGVHFDPSTKIWDLLEDEESPEEWEGEEGIEQREELEIGETLVLTKSLATSPDGRERIESPLEKTEPLKSLRSRGDGDWPPALSPSRSSCEACFRLLPAEDLEDRFPAEEPAEGFPFEAPAEVLPVEGPAEGLPSDGLPSLRELEAEPSARPASLDSMCLSMTPQTSS